MNQGQSSTVDLEETERIPAPSAEEVEVGSTDEEASPPRGCFAPPGLTI